MKYSGYNPTLHALTVKHHKPTEDLTADMWERWWRTMSDDERQVEFDTLMACDRAECPICSCSNGHSLSCPTLGVVPVLDLQVTRTIQAH